MPNSYELNRLYELLEVYKDKLSDAINRGDEVDIRHWKNNIKGLENKIAGLEYND